MLSIRFVNTEETLSLENYRDKTEKNIREGIRLHQVNNPTEALDHLIYASSLYLFDPYILTHDEENLFKDLKAILAQLLTIHGQTYNVENSDFLINNLAREIENILPVNSTTKDNDVNLKQTHLNGEIPIEIIFFWQRIGKILFAQNKKSIALKFFYFACKNIQEICENYSQHPYYSVISESYANAIYDRVIRSPAPDVDKNLRDLTQAINALASIASPYRSNNFDLSIWTIQKVKTQILMHEANDYVKNSNQDIKKRSAAYYEAAIKTNILRLTVEGLQHQNEFINNIIQYTDAVIADGNEADNIILYKNIIFELAKIPIQYLAVEQLTLKTHYQRVLIETYINQGKQFSFNFDVAASACDVFNAAIETSNQILAQLRLDTDNYNYKYCLRKFTLFTLLTIINPTSTIQYENAIPWIKQSIENNRDNSNDILEQDLPEYYGDQRLFAKQLNHLAEVVFSIKKDLNAAIYYNEAATESLQRIPQNCRSSNDNNNIEEYQAKLAEYRRAQPLSIFSSPIPFFNRAPTINNPNLAASADLTRSVSLPIGSGMTL